MYLCMHHNNNSRCFSKYGYILFLVCRTSATTRQTLILQAPKSNDFSKMFASSITHICIAWEFHIEFVSTMARRVCVVSTHLWFSVVAKIMISWIRYGIAIARRSQLAVAKNETRNEQLPTYLHLYVYVYV